MNVDTANSPAWPEPQPVIKVTEQHAYSIGTINNAKSAELEWPNLISLDAPELPTLDLSLFPGFLGNFAMALSNSTETPAELPGAMVLGIAATACARRLIVEVNSGYVEPTNLWLAAGLDPANLKSANLNAALSPLIQLERDMAEVILPQIKEAESEQKTIESRIKALRAAAANIKTKADDLEKYKSQIIVLESELPEIPINPRFWTSDSTPETLGVMLAQQGECMAVISSEGGIFDMLGGRYSSGVPNLDLFLKAHAGDPDVTDRLSRDSVRLEFPRLSVVLSPQPEVFNWLSSIKGGEGRGLFARFLFFLPKSRIGTRTLDGPPVPDTVRNAYHAGIQAMFNWEASPDNRNGCHTLRLSDDAREQWQKFRQYLESEMGPNGSFTNYKKWVGKAGGAAVRVAGVFHGAKHADGRPWDLLIDGDTMAAALEFVAVSMAHSIAVLDSIGADQAMTNAKILLEWLRRKQLPTVTIRNIHSGLKHKFPEAKIVKDAAVYLEERGYVQIREQEPTGGRPSSPNVTVRPSVLAGRQ